MKGKKHLEVLGINGGELSNSVRRGGLECEAQDSDQWRVMNIWVVQKAGNFVTTKWL
jgi:hypothetical protein